LSTGSNSDEFCTISLNNLAYILKVKKPVNGEDNMAGLTKYLFIKNYGSIVDNPYFKEGRELYLNEKDKFSPYTEKPISFSSLISSITQIDSGEGDRARVILGWYSTCREDKGKACRLTEQLFTAAKKLGMFKKIDYFKEFMGLMDSKAQVYGMPQEEPITVTEEVMTEIPTPESKLIPLYYVD
jgi:hypothetical protein